MTDLTNLLQRDATYIQGAFDPDLVTLDNVENYLNNHKFAHDELKILRAETNDVEEYGHHKNPWRSEYDPACMENLWESGYSFILHSPFVSDKLKEAVRTIEAHNGVTCDSHIYMGKKHSESYPPHNDPSHSLNVQCAGRTHWKVWQGIYDGVSFDLDYEPIIDVIMEPGDAILVKKGQIHQAQPITDRIGVSFQFYPGPSSIQRDIRLSWETVA